MLTLIRCWEGAHAIKAAVSLIAFSYYMPLSIMVSPMLTEAGKTLVSIARMILLREFAYTSLWLMIDHVVNIWVMKGC